MADNLQEAVDKHVFEIKILCGNARNETEEHLGRIDMILGRINEPDAVFEIEHILVVVIDEHHAPFGRYVGFVGDIDDAFGFAGAFFAEDYTYQDLPPSARCAV